MIKFNAQELDLNAEAFKAFHQGRLIEVRATTRERWKSCTAERPEWNGWYFRPVPAVTNQNV